MQPVIDPATAALHYNHVRILLGMILGLALTHLLRQIARIIERPQAQPVYWLHLGWVFFMFITLVHFWWWEFRLAEHTDWTFNLYLFVTFYALLLYLLSALVLPENMQDYHGYRDYYYSRRGWFFALLALAFVTDLFDTAIKGHAYFTLLGPEYLWRNGLFIVASLYAIRSRSPVFHGGFMLLAVAYEISWIVRRYETLAA